MLNQKQIPERKRGRPRKKLEDKLSEVLTTDKQKAFLRNRMMGMNKRQAAIQAGYSPKTASIMAKRLTDRLSGNKIFLEEMERQGLTLESIVGMHKELLFNSMNPFRPDMPDNVTRLKAMEMAYKMLGYFQPQKAGEHKIENSCELTVDDVKHAERHPEKKVLKETDEAEEGKNPTREEDEPIF